MILTGIMRSYTGSKIQTGYIEEGVQKIRAKSKMPRN